MSGVVTAGYRLGREELSSEALALACLGRVLGAVGVLNACGASPVNLESGRNHMRDAGWAEAVEPGILSFPPALAVRRLLLETGFAVFEGDAFTWPDPLTFNDLRLTIDGDYGTNTQRVVAASVFERVGAASFPIVLPRDHVLFRQGVQLPLTRRVRFFGQLARIYGHVAKFGDVHADARNAPLESANLVLSVLCASLAALARDDADHAEDDRDDDADRANDKFPSHADISPRGEHDRRVSA